MPSILGSVFLTDGRLVLLVPESGIPFDVVAAIDINQISNSIYHHNFPRTKLRAKCLTVKLTTKNFYLFHSQLLHSSVTLRNSSLDWIHSTFSLVPQFVIQGIKMNKMSKIL